MRGTAADGIQEGTDLFGSVQSADRRPKSAGDAFPAGFQAATKAWFLSRFDGPTPAQSAGWAAIAGGDHTLIAAPTGAGKTLAAFLSAIDGLVADAADGALGDKTLIVYVSPLKALGNDVERNLAEPLAGIAAAARDRGTEVAITTAVRTGDTSQAARARMVRRPPHILVTTPEGLYALVTSKGGRSMLDAVKTVIVDEIHALAPDRRGAHLSITLERLDALVGQPVQRIGLSATQKPVETVARFLTGGRDCAIVDEGHARERDLMIETPGAPLAAIMSNEVWEEVYDRVAALVGAHRTTLVFVNSRRQCERVAHQLAERLGGDHVASHHGSLSQPLRRDAETRLKAGDLKVLVATASLELGIDIGDVDLVIQLGAVKRIAMFLQRVGRACHWNGGVPKGRLFPLSRDELVECVALLRCVEQGTLDRLAIPDHPLDVLAQQIVAPTVAGEWAAEDLFALMRGAYPYRSLSRKDFDGLLDMLASGFPTERGRRGALLHYDRVNGRVSARPGARITCLASGGSIPDSGDYTVRLEPQGVVVGAVAEDFAIHQMPGHVIQLGSNSWRILQVKAGEVRVESAAGETPYMPVWFGEAPARSEELSDAVSALKAEVATAPSAEAAMDMLKPHAWLDAFAAGQLVAYLRAAGEALQAMPTRDTVVTERFLDLAGNEQVVVHAPFGARVNRAWALALRHMLGRRHAVDLQAAATDDAILLSLPGQVRFPLAETYELVTAATAADIVAEAVLDVPMFMIRWRWAASRALVVPRQRGSYRVPPHIQRTDADELLLTAFPSRRVVRPMRLEGRQGGLQSAGRPGGETDNGVAMPDHPLVRQTLHDCLHEAMDLPALIALLRRIESGDVAARVIERLQPSPAAFNVITAKPPAFIDNGALMDRRARNVGAEPPHLAVESGLALHPQAVARVEAELMPDMRSIEDLAAHLSLSGVVTKQEVEEASPWLVELEADGRVRSFTADNGAVLWASVDRLPDLAAVFPQLRSSGEQRGGRSPDDALARLLHGRLETSGPVTAGTVAADLGCPVSLVEQALDRLEAEGSVLRIAPHGDAPGEPRWCDRRVLARIERMTRNRLRAEIEPVTLQQFYRFLLRWHGLTSGDRRRGRDGLAQVLSMLDGVELPAGLWEADVLAARVGAYDLDDLDELCLSGRFGWGRLTRPSDGKAKRVVLSSATPVALFDSEHAAVWRGLSAGSADGRGLSGPAEKLLDQFEQRGASFIGQIERSVRMLKSEYETGLMELVALGLIASDSFAGLRALLAKPSKLRVSRLDIVGNSNSGRWSLLPPSDPIDDPVARMAAVETYALSVLRRYGVVVRNVVQREGSGVKWLELLRVLRRMEARGTVRGGYFVNGAGGEHYALPEALPLLREVRGREPDGELTDISAADPINLTGVLTPGRRIASRTTRRILLKDALPVAMEERGKIRLLDENAALTSGDLAQLRRGPAPAALSVYG